MKKVKVKVVEFPSDNGTIHVSKKAYEGIQKKAFITSMKIINGMLHIEYESKCGKVKGSMDLKDISQSGNFSLEICG